MVASASPYTWPSQLRLYSRLIFSRMSGISWVIPLPPQKSRPTSVVILRSPKHDWYRSTQPHLALTTTSPSEIRTHERRLYVAKTPDVDNSIPRESLRNGTIVAPKRVMHRLTNDFLVGSSLWRWVNIESGAAITNSDLLASHRGRWKKELENLVRDFHVHGRLTRPSWRRLGALSLVGRLG